MSPRGAALRRMAAVLAVALLAAACSADDTGTTADDVVAEQTTTTAATSTESTGGSASPTTATTITTLPGGADQVIEVSVSGESVDGGGRHVVAVGDTVAIVVTSDVADEIHVHGYDVYADIGPGGPVTALVEATIPGVWEVELHDSGLFLLELAVS